MAQVTFQRLIDEVADDGYDAECIERFQFACSVKNLTTKTVMGYAERILYLHRYATKLNKELTELGTRDIQQYILSLLGEVSPETVNGRIRVYKVFYACLTEEKLLENNPMLPIKAVRTERKIKPVVTPEQVGTILSQYDRRTFHGSRDYCMLLLTFDAMLRLSELLSIRLKDIDLKSRLVKVYGKGRKERYSPFSELTARRIRTYINRHRHNITGDFLFPMGNGQRVSDRRAYTIFSRQAKRLGIRLYPHLMRHSGASQFIRNGGSVNVLQRILGHSSLAITEKYVHLSTKDIVHGFNQCSPLSNVPI